MWIKAALLIPERGQTAVHGSWWCRLNWGVMGRTNPPFQLGPRVHTVNSGFPLVPNQPNNISEDQHTMKQFHSSITYKKHLSEKRRSGMLPELTDRTKERALREPTHTHTHTPSHTEKLFFTFIWIRGLYTSSEAGSCSSSPLSGSVDWTHLPRLESGPGTRLFCGTSNSTAMLPVLLLFICVRWALVQSSVQHTQTEDEQASVS